MYCKCLHLAGFLFVPRLLLALLLDCPVVFGRRLVIVQMLETGLMVVK